MPEVDLSALNGRELRRLLDASRARGNEALSSGITQELATRSERPPEAGTFMTLRPPEQRFLSVELDDPFEDDDLASAYDGAEGSKWLETRPAPPPDPEVAPPRLDSAEQQPRDRDTAGAAGPGLSRVRTRRAVTGSGLLLAGFGLGLAVAVLTARWMVGDGPHVLSQPPPATAVSIQAETPAAMPFVAPGERLAADTVVGGAIPQPQPSAVRERASAAPVPARSPSSRHLAKPGLKKSGSDAAKRCGKASGPADRAVCADPKLRRLQAELLRSYGRAQNAHVDRGWLRQRQLAWREAHKGVVDRRRLAGLYEERIRWLNATAATARRHR